MRNSAFSDKCRYAVNTTFTYNYSCTVTHSTALILKAFPLSCSLVFSNCRESNQFKAEQDVYKNEI